MPVVRAPLADGTPESGETMKAAGLKAIDTVVSSTAILIKSRNPFNPSLVKLITARIRGVISEATPAIPFLSWVLSANMTFSETEVRPLPI